MTCHNNVLRALFFDRFVKVWEKKLLVLQMDLDYLILFLKLQLLNMTVIYTNVSCFYAPTFSIVITILFYVAYFDTLLQAPGSVEAPPYHSKYIKTLTERYIKKNWINKWQHICLSRVWSNAKVNFPLCILFLSPHKSVLLSSSKLVIEKKKKMLESLVANILNRFLKNYVSNLNYDQLKIGMWKGKTFVS